MRGNRIIIAEVINELNRYGFSKTVDSINEYSSEADLYYLKIEHQKYLILNHYNKKRKIELQGFDCWVSFYESENDIGKKKAIQADEVQLNFQVNRDWHLIAKYIILHKV